MPDFAQLAKLFELTVPVWELAIRGSAMYWFLFLAFRFVLRRDMGSVGIADILVLVVVADAAQNAMSGGYESISDGMILVGVLLGWNLLLDFLGYRFSAIGRFLEPAPLPLVRNGRMIRRNMRVQFITEDELHTKLRQNGVESLAQVKAMYLEPDGEVSVIKNKTD
ncbi:MAG: DUF421 domain-containing protein [Prolixibacteraceae bacterium]|nr:DUF421 domain-containing protein [Burkholderiales bacterium]